jgi:YD repeat-containing protein
MPVGAGAFSPVGQRKWTSMLWIVLALMSSTAQAASYVYDANDRLRAVTADSGASSEYIYDALGNLLAVNSVPAGQLVIFAFSPNHGPAGLPGVTIYGQGFSTTPANNTVTFHGTGAVVASATSNQLLVTVPAGATTGPISVTVGTVNASSVDDFIVTSDANGLPPTIASFSPTLAMANSLITVNGAHFTAPAGSVFAGVNSALAPTTPTSDAQLTFNVSATTGSGLVSVITAYGSAQSPQPLIVAPAQVGTLANVISNLALAIDGAAQPINFTATGKYAVASFQGTAGQWLSLQFSQYSAGSNPLNLKIYDETGAVWLDLVNVYATSLSIHLPQLPRSGVYTVLLWPNVPVQFSVALESNPRLSTTTPTTLTSTVPGQTKRAIFFGQQQQYLGVKVASATVTPSGNLGVVLVDPSNGFGTQIGNVSSSTSPFFVNAYLLTRTGDNGVVLSAATTATFSAALTAVSNPSTVLTLNSTSSTISTTVPNENSYLAFQGTAGQNISVALSNFSYAPTSGSSPTLKVFPPSGSQLGAALSCVVPGCHFAIDSLPVTGVYRVWIQPSFQTMAFLATVSNDVAGTLVPNVPSNLNLSLPGQTARFGFSGTAGQRLSYYFSGFSTAPAGGNVSWTTFNPDGTILSTGQTTSTATQNLPVLPQTGSYTIKVEPQYADTATGSLTLIPNPTAAITLDGPSSNISTTVPSQNAFLSFQASVGQNLTFALASFSTNPSTFAIYTIFKPDGSTLWSDVCYTPGCHYGLTNLQQSGTYLVSVVPSGAATMSFAASLSSDLVGSLASGTLFNVGMARAGQVGRLTFSGAVGDRWSLSLAGATTSPAGGNVYLKVFNPDGSAVSSGSGQTTSSFTLNLPALTQNGTYTAQVEPQYADTGTAQLTLMQAPTISLTIDGGTGSVATTAGGENAYLSFSATAGQNLSLAFANLSTTPSGFVSYSIYKPDGQQLTSNSLSPPGGHVALTALPASGTYTVTVSPWPSNATMTFAALVSSDVTGTLTTGSAYPLSLPQPGQVARLTFAGSAGQTGGIYVGSVNTTPANAYVTLTTFNPDGSALSGVSGNIATSGTVNFPRLAQSGTYVLQVDPQYADTAAANVTLLAPTALTVNGSSVPISTTLPGQNVYLTFSGTAPQNVTLRFTGLTITPSAQPQVTVYGTTGTQLSSTSCATSGCNIPLTNLPAGTYSVIVAAPTNSTTMTFTAAVTSP